MKPGDFIILALALVLALCPLLALPPLQRGGAVAVVRQDGRIVAELPLNRDARLTFSAHGTNVVRVEGGAVRIERADCPDRTCVARGPIRRAGQTLVCLPHRLTVSIEGGTSVVDAVSQ